MKSSNILITAGLPGIFASIAVSLSGPHAAATALTWDITPSDGATITDGSGAWTTGAGNWNSGAANVNWTTGDSATFNGATGGTITVGAAGVSQTGLTFGGANNYTVSGGAIGGAGGLTKNGSGTVSLTGANTLTGNLSVTAGTLELNGGSLNNLAGNVVVNSGLTLTNGSLITSSATSYGTTTGFNLNGTINISGTSTLTRSSATNYATIGRNAATTWTQTGGTVNINGQGLDIYDNTTLSISGGSFTAGSYMYLTSSNTVGVGATLSVSGTGSVTTGTLSFSHPSQTNGKSTVNLNAGGLLQATTLNHAKGTGHALNFNGGTLRAGGINASWLSSAANLTATVKSGGAVIDSNTYDVGIAQALVHDPALGATADGGLTKNGNGTLTLSATNTYTGTTTINAGTVATANSASLGSGMIDIKAAGTYAFSTTGSNKPAFSNAVSGAGAFTVTGSSGNQSYWSGDWSGFSGTLTINPAASIWARSSSNTGSTAMKVNLSGNMGLHDNESNITRTYHIGELTGASGSQIFGQPDTNNAVTLSVGALGTSTTFGGSIRNNWSGNTTSTVGLTKVGGGTLALTGGNTYTGTTKIEGGTLALSGGNAIADTGAVVIANAVGPTLQLNAGETIGSLSGGGTLALGGNNLTIAGSANTTFGGTVTGSGAILQTGGGTLTLTGASTGYSGTSTVSAGTMYVNGTLGGNLSAGAGTTVGGTGLIGGNLAFAPASFFDIFLVIGDSLSVGGTVTFGAGPSGPGSGFGIDNLTGITWSSVADAEYTLITGTVNTANLDNFGLANAYDIGDGRKAYFESGSLKLVVIPEPATAVLLGLGSLGLALRRRR